MSRNEQKDENVFPMLVAGLGCLASVPVIYLATCPAIWLMPLPGLPWLLAGLFTMVPVSVAFLILYCSAWHDERPVLKRIFSAVISSCILFGVDLLAAGAFVAICCLIVGLSRQIGGN